MRAWRTTVTRTCRPQPAGRGQGNGNGKLPLAFRADPIDRIRSIQLGIAASSVVDMARRMELPKERLIACLGLARATIDRKVREGKLLSSDESERVLGMARLVGQVQAMVEESGNPAGFNAATWLSGWL